MYGGELDLEYFVWPIIQAHHQPKPTISQLSFSASFMVKSFLGYRPGPCTLTQRIVAFG